MKIFQCKLKALCVNQTLQELFLYFYFFFSVHEHFYKIRHSDFVVLDLNKVFTG